MFDTPMTRLRGLFAIRLTVFAHLTRRQRVTSADIVTELTEVTDVALIAARALIALGDTPDMVAAALTAAGYLGLPATPYRCPIAEYVKATDPRIVDIAVHPNTIYIDTPGESVTVVPPDPVRVFITCFDVGDYPDLNASSLLNGAVDPGPSGSDDADGLVVW